MAPFAENRLAPDGIYRMSDFPKTELGWRLRALWGGYKLDRWSVRIGKLIAFIVIIGFSVGATYFFQKVFHSLLELEGIGEPLLWRVVGMTLTTVFVMLVVSNLITGIATLYKSNEIIFMMTRPVPFKRVFLNQFSDNLAYSSWSLAVLGVPLIFAWGTTFHVNALWVLGIIFFGLWPMIIISAVIGAAGLMGLIFIAHKTSSSFTMGLVLIIIAVSIAMTAVNRNRQFIVEGAARTSTIERYISSLARENRAPLVPSSWLSIAMRSVSRGDQSRALFLIGLLSLTATVWLRWLGVTAGRHYYASWTFFSEITGQKSRGEPPHRALRFNRGLFPNPAWAMLRKDLLQFVRSPSQWAQFMILIAFLIIYLMNLIYVSSRFNFEAPYWKTMVLFLNFSFTGFILATLSVRFVFPLVSLEGRGYWVVRSAPVTTKLLFLEKFTLAFIVFMGLCELIVYISGHVLHVRGGMMILMTTGTFLMGATLTGVAIGMGAIFPDFKEESPMRIASSPGGVLTVIVSLVYVGIMVSFMAWPARGYFHYLLGRAPFPTDRVTMALAAIILLNGLALFLPIRAGYRAMAVRDI